MLSKYISPNSVIYEPFSGKGAYTKRFPEFFPLCRHVFTEIEDGLDFFDYKGESVDVIISNPPFSILEKVFERCYLMKPKIISFLLLQHAITPCRLRKANEAGYFVLHYHLCRMDKWFGVAGILTLSNEITENIISFDCTKHILEKEREEEELVLELV